MTNSNFDGHWFNLSDHTTGDETGNMAIINGSNPGKDIIRTMVFVKANTDYVFSAWVSNIDKLKGEELPLFRVEILSGDGDVLYDEDLDGNLEATDIPTWNQIGSVFNSGNNRLLTIRFLSEGGAANGNDYALDDISLYELAPAPVTDLVKSVDENLTKAGEVLTYNIVFENTGIADIQSVVLSDIIPDFTSIIPGTLYINGELKDDAQIESGILVGDISSGDKVNIQS